jgi:uncharacterized membrane protein YbhN (UPF0104 family)
MKAEKRKITLRISIIPVIILCVYFPISNYYPLIDNNNLVAQLLSLGFPVLIILFPYSFITLSDTCGWLLCFSKKTPHLSLVKLYVIRLATESLQMSLPGGALYSDLVRPYLLKKHFQIEYPESISAGILTKLNILIAQILFILFGFMALLVFFTRNVESSDLLSGPSIYIGLLTLLTLTFLFAYLLYRKNLLLWILFLLEKVKFRKVEKVLCRIKQQVVDINNIISVFSQNHKTNLFLTVAFFFLTWILMSLESLVILKVIGIDASIFQMILIEALVSIVRMSFFFIPGAVGPQDAALIILFNLVGLPDPAVNAVLFVILKRSKELIWIIVGYLLLMLLGIKPGKLRKEKKLNFATEG